MGQILSANQQQAVQFYVISDSIGETAQRVIYAVLAQFPEIDSTEIKKYPFIDNNDDLIGILKDALVEQAIVVTTLVNRELNQITEKFAAETGLRHVDYMSDLMALISEQTNLQPIFKSGALHQMDEEYFNRVAAIEFAVKYDDGKNPKGFLKSDIVLLGISRTSKTPLSMYLANKAYKVSNLPLIPEVKVPPEIMEVPSEKIFGLVASPQYIMRIRSERVKMMGLGPSASYNSLDRIKGELTYADELFEKLGANIVSVENRSIEETAQQIELKMKQNHRSC